MARPKKEQPNRADGRYEIKAVIGKNFKGEPIRKSFYSYESKTDAKKQAEEYKVNMEVAARTGETFIAKDVTFKEWAKKWLETYKKPDVSENTYAYTYLNTVNKHLLPYFGKSDLKTIKPVDIKKFYADNSYLSESMLDKIKMCLNAIFETAIDNDLCIKNPAKSIKFVSDKVKTEKKVYTNKQIQLVEKFAKEFGMPEVVILLETGLRRGELMGLTWKDIDLKEQTISINRSIADKIGGETTVNPPKWNSYRTNPLSDEALKIFSELPHKNKYIFSLHKSKPFSPNTWSKRLEKFMEIMHKKHPSIPALTAHELRHTHGTELRRRGVDIYTIQKVMGHKDIKMTTEIYVHNEIEVLKQALKK